MATLPRQYQRVIMFHLTIVSRLEFGESSHGIMRGKVVSKKITGMEVMYYFFSIKTRSFEVTST